MPSDSFRPNVSFHWNCIAESLNRAMLFLVRRPSRFPIKIPLILARYTLSCPMPIPVLKEIREMQLLESRAGMACGSAVSQERWRC